MKSKQKQSLLTLTEAAMMLAMGTVLSLLKLVDLPYGGSITLASMLPLVVFAYRHGLLWGLGLGVVHGGLQQLLGLNTLSYVTTWQSILAVIFLDYVLAYACMGVAGAFRHSRHPFAPVLGGVLGCVLRYICHVFSGATVWAGISIPTAAAMAYSIGYNATYLLPETLVLTVCLFYLCGNLDLQKAIPTRRRHAITDTVTAVLYLICGLLLAGALVYDTVAFFPCLQDAESGECVFANAKNAPFGLMGIVTGATILVCVVLVVIARFRKKTDNQENSGKTA